MRLYLDEMISPAVAGAPRGGGGDAVAAVERNALGLSDAAQLARAIHEQRAMVTYNIGDFVALAKAAASGRQEHWGIVLVSPQTIPPSDIGGLTRALQDLAAGRPAADALKNQTVFLARPGE